MKDEIPFAEGLTLPLTAVTTRFAHMGNIGSGKSYGAMKIAEGMMDCGAQVVVIDPVGIWYGLRILPNGKPSGYDIPIFGGLHGDVPLAPTAGAMIADLIVDRKINAVLDTSMFETDADLHRFISAFGARFFFRKKQVRSAVHLMIEEAQEVLPQNPQHEEVKTLHHFQRMAKIGRNFGIGMSLITQRPQDTNKKALNLTECVVCYQFNGSQERQRMKEWIIDKDLDVELLKVLPTIQRGRPYIWSPRWLKVIKQYDVLKKRTADVSATPEHGDVEQLEPVKMTEKELAALSEQIEKTVNDAKHNDPKELHKEVARLRAELEQSKKALTSMEGKVKTKDKPVLTEKDYVRFSTVANDVVAKMSKEIVPLILKLGQVAPATPVPTPIPPREVPNPNYKPAPFRVKTFGQVQIGPPPKSVDGEIKIGKAERAILSVVATYPGANRKKIAIMAGYSRKGGSFINSMGSLRTAGLIEGGTEQQQECYLTEQGKALYGDVPPPPTGHDLYRMWINQLEACEREILRVLWENKREMTKDEIASLTVSNKGTPYEPSGGSFINALGALRTRDLIVGSNPIRLSEDFL